MQNRWYAVGSVITALLLGGLAHAAPLDGKTLRDLALQTPATGEANVANGTRKFGLVSMSDADLAKSARVVVHLGARGINNRPKSILLTEYLPPVADQGHQNSCVGWSTAYYCYSYSVAHNYKLAPDVRKQDRWQFSPAFLYHTGNGGKDVGMSIGSAFKLLTEQGCATMAEMPYVEQDTSTPPGSDAKKRAQQYKAEKTGCLTSNNGESGAFSAEAAKVYLATARNPFVIGIPVFTDFFNAQHTPGYVYSPDASQTKDKNFLGWHAITIVGYDDDLHAFRMVNSWGTGWGDQGFLWLSEDFLTFCGRDGWCQMPKLKATRQGPGEEPLMSFETPAVNKH